jgi:3-isopropylmalate dehydrogenase
VADRIAKEASAVLLGAMGDPRVPDLGYAREILFGLRFGLDLYANVRPIKALADRLVPLGGRKAKDVDFVVFRENTEGIYVNVGGQFKRGTPDEVAINEDVNTRKGVERLIVAGFEHAKKHGKTVVHMADKSNAMQHAHELWYRTFFEVAKRYPGITPKHMYVDAMCMHFVMDPSQFQVVVTCNLFGDILTDLGAALQGGMGMAASANLYAAASPLTGGGEPTRVAMFEPVHGSAPPLAGKDLANPLRPHRRHAARPPGRLGGGGGARRNRASRGRREEMHARRRRDARHPRRRRLGHGRVGQGHDREGLAARLPRPLAAVARGRNAGSTQQGWWPGASIG